MTTFTLGATTVEGASGGRDIGTDGQPNGELEPYVYVGPWYPDDRPESSFWNGESFPGAVLRHADLMAADDPRSTAKSFLKEGRDLLTPS